MAVKKRDRGADDRAKGASPTHVNPPEPRKRCPRCHRSDRSTRCPLCNPAQEDMQRMPLTEEPCPRCLALAKSEDLRPEMVQRLPQGAWAPLGIDGKRQCHDCTAAELVQRCVNLPTFLHARIAVGNERQEQYRMPGAPLGLVRAGYVRRSFPGDLDDQHAWLDRQKWFGVDPERTP